MHIQNYRFTVQVQVPDTVKLKDLKLDFNKVLVQVLEQYFYEYLYQIAPFSHCTRSSFS